MQTNANPSNPEVVSNHSDAVEWLRDEYSRRRARNANYSLRAFAKHLHVGSGPLSEILAKKRVLSSRMASRITERLMLTPADRQRFLSLLAAPLSSPSPFRPLADDAFRVIADWQHFGILSLLETKGARSDARWIGTRLGISAEDAQIALDRLTRLEMIRADGDRLVPVSGWATSSDIPSQAIRKFHRQTIQLALGALEEVPVEERDVTSITVAVDVANLPRAKSLIRKFRRQLSDLLEAGERSEVYQLNIQLIPVSRKESHHA